MAKIVLASESLFRPVNGMQSTHLLVEIHNIFNFTTQNQISEFSRLIITTYKCFIIHSKQSSLLLFWRAETWQNLTFAIIKSSFCCCCWSIKHYFVDCCCDFAKKCCFVDCCCDFTKKCCTSNLSVFGGKLIDK